VLRRADERGFTLVELAVAMTIMLLVAGALLAALESGTMAERHASNRINSEQSASLALAQFARDVRNATTVIPITTKLNQIDLWIGSAHVRWYYDFVGHILQRKAYIGVSGSANVVNEVTGVTNPTGTVFTVFSADGTDLLTLPDGTRGDIATCAATIEASVTATAPAPSAPFTVSTSEQLHRAADQRGCP
jgi:prepilin-type N-terminal cleavage/methylation domain-containing protein